MTQANATLTDEQKRQEKEVAKNIGLARYIMADKTPFFGILSQQLKIKAAPLHLRNVIRTAAVTPTGICMYNPDFMSPLTFEQLCGVLAHEALHPGLDFFGRFENKKLSLANRAHDYAINLLIKDNKTSGLDLPEFCLLEEKYRGISAEEIYFILDDEDKKKKKEQSDGSGQSEQGDSSESSDDKEKGQGQGQQSKPSKGQGEGQSQSQSKDDSGQNPSQGSDYTLEDDISKDVIDAIENEYYGETGNRPTKEEMHEQREQAKQRWKDALEQAVIAEQNSGKGNLPAWLQTEIDGILNPKLNISKMLRRYFGKFGQRTKSTYKKRNRRNLFTGDVFPRPGLKSSKPSLYVLLDTSGSMWDTEGFNMVKGTLGVIKNLANNGGYGVRIIMCDTDVTEDLAFDDVMKAVNKKSLKAMGGGGSNFIPAFEYIWADAVTSNNSQAPILCITDGYIDVPSEQPRIRTETMWVTPQGIRPPTTEWGTHGEMIF